MLKILPNTYLPVTIKNQWELEKENYKKLNGVILTDFKDNLLGTLCQALFFLLSPSLLLNSKKVKLEEKGYLRHLIDFIVLDSIVYCIYCTELNVLSVLSRAY